MGGGAAGGLWRQQQWSPSWLPFWILPRIRNQVKTSRLVIFCALHEKQHINEHSQLQSQLPLSNSLFTVLFAYVVCFFGLSGG